MKAYKFVQFGKACVSINALSDTHGCLKYANNALEEMEDRQQDIFYPKEKGKANILAICGDWFIDGAKTGFKTNPDKKNIFFQLDIFNEFVNQVKKLASDSMTTLFTPGNHEFDGGVELLDDVISNIDSEVIMTNVNIQNSPAFNDSISKNKIVNEKIIEVDDDKNPNLKHKFLFLGVIPVNMSTYQRNMSGVSLTDNVPKYQTSVQKEDYKDTLEYCKKRISDFKEENPNGIVILLSHTGVNFADNLAKESTLDLVFDAHEHKNKIRYSNGTPIIPLSMNFKKIANAKIKTDDNGKLENIEIKSFNPLFNNKQGTMSELYNKLFKDDIEPIYSLKTNNPDIENLDLDNIRAGNNYLANFVTDSVLEEIRKKDKSVDFFALNSSSIRYPLKISDDTGISSIDVMNVLAGIREEDGKIMLTELSGKDTVYLILDNYLFNKDKPQQNSIIQYSGLITNKTKMLQEYESGASIEDLSKFVIDERTQSCIDTKKTYKIANVEKYFDKNQNKNIRDLKTRSQYTGDTVQSLFKEHFENSDGTLYAKCDIRIK